MGWTPEQIVGRMGLEEVEHRTSVESIYRYVYSPEGRGVGLPRQLAQRKAKRGRRRRNGRREPSIPNRVSVPQRPTKAHLHAEFGHWEGDLVHFRRQRDILLTLQERVTRLTLGRRLRSKDAALTASAIVAELGALPAKARRAITHPSRDIAARCPAGQRTMAASSQRMRASPGKPGCVRSFAILTVRGNVVGSRTPTA